MSEAGIEISAYYFPNYHVNARNDQWYGRGWTEWELVRAARPRYPGHVQPKVPAWGEFNEADPAWAECEIALAADHGIGSFLYDWYWYDGQSYLHEALEQGFLQATNRQRLKFALMWANHDWNDIHPARTDRPSRRLAEGNVSPVEFDRMTDYLVAHYLGQPNYLTIDGCPYFSIYAIAQFLQGIGGIEQARSALARFRAKVRTLGFPDIHLNGIIWGLGVLPGEVAVRDPAVLVRELGFSSVTNYTWVHYYDPSTLGFPKGSYVAAAEANYAAWQKYRDAFSVPYYPHVSMGWDPSPRTDQKTPYEKREYPWTAVLDGNTPAAFGAALERACAFAAADKRAGNRLITLNAWNEWTEGSYLLPDTVQGNGYLEQIRRAFERVRTC